MILSNLLAPIWTKYGHACLILCWTLIAGALAGFSLRPESAHPWAAHFFKVISDDTAKKVKHLLSASDSETVLQECVSKVRQGMLPIENDGNQQELESYLSRRLRDENGLQSLSYTDQTTGCTTSARREGEELSVTRILKGSYRKIVVGADGATSSEDIRSERQYDPYNCSWYQAAIGSGNTIWTKPYKFEDGGMGITAALVFRPAPDSPAKGVFAANYNLADIPAFLDGIRDGNYIFVLDRDGTKIATPPSQNSIAADPILTRMAEQLSLHTLQPKDPRKFTVQIGDKKYETCIEAFQASENLQWINAIAVPERFIAGASASWASLSALARIGAMFLALSMAGYLAFVFVRNRNKTNLAEKIELRAPEAPQAIAAMRLPTFSLQALCPHRKPAMNISDLSCDRVLAMTPQAEVDGTQVPLLLGIPLLAKIGQGGCGAVYYGIHPQLKKEVAVKVLSVSLISNEPEWEGRFKREAQLSAMINSPFVVSVFDAGEQNGLFLIVMEYINGISAGDYLKTMQDSGQIGLPEDEAMEICRAATMGLMAAHEMGVIHRDIKPDNIMLPFADNGGLRFAAAKLMDFGMARAETCVSLTASQIVLGTIGYMAPEQTRGSKYIAQEADVFSMGATLYALLTGTPPFSGESPFEALVKTVDDKHRSVLEMRPDVTQATAALIDRCLKKRPIDRFANGAELLAAFERCSSIRSLAR